MATGVYIGVNGTARKVKNIYLGVSGTARKVKKGYIGDANGKARLFFQASSGLVKYSGNVSSLSNPREVLSATTVGDYALFSGGYNTWSQDTVDAYNTGTILLE